VHICFIAFSYGGIFIILFIYSFSSFFCSNQDHVNQYCWTHTLYHYPNLTDRSVMPYALNAIGGMAKPDAGEKDMRTVTFFRWVTIYFVVQAFLFKVRPIVLKCWKKKNKTAQ
jgi:hypothetical protein